MNARYNTPLRTLIADRLAAGEDTAAGIAQAIGKGDTPSTVVKELNAMRTDGQVECEQRGKKKELVYWLAVPLEVAAGIFEPGGEAALDEAKRLAAQKVEDGECETAKICALIPVATAARRVVFEPA